MEERQLSRKLIAGLVALAAVGGTGFAAGSALSGTDDAPEYAPLTIDLGKERAATRAKAIGGTTTPKLVYLQSSTPTTVNTADPPAGIGPYVDLRLKGCSKVVTGGVSPLSTDVYVQGSYIESPKVFHVLVALDDAAAAASPRPTFQVDTNLTCLKGVK